MGCMLSRDIARLARVVDRVYDSQVLLDKRIDRLENQVNLIDDDIMYIERKMRKHKKKTHIHVNDLRDNWREGPPVATEYDSDHSDDSVSDEIHINLKEYAKAQVQQAQVQQAQVPHSQVKHTEKKVGRKSIVHDQLPSQPPVTNTSMKKLHVITQQKK